MTDGILDAIILGIVEGLTEFVPVSSTGHLIVAEAALRRDAAANGVFDVFIQTGAILAVVWARRARLLRMTRGLAGDRGERRALLLILLAFLPCAAAGVLLHDFIKNVLFSPWVVGASLVTGGIFMLAAERLAPPPRIHSMDEMPLKTALGIGLCQLLALIPGVSRAGASIVGARMIGVDLAAAAEFSFFLAIPTIFGAAALDLYKNLSLLSPHDFPVFAVGTLTAFIAALMVVRHLIAFLTHHGFRPFGYYRIVAGLSILLLLAMGWL